LLHHQAAERALEARAPLDPNDAVAKRNFADQLVMTATLQNSVQDGAGALAGTARALPILHALAEADPDNVEAQHDLAFAYTQIAARTSTCNAGPTPPAPPNPRSRCRRASSNAIHPTANTAATWPAFTK
jgi:hypothetical protein